jgi:hypothetical protein
MPSPSNSMAASLKRVNGAVLAEFDAFTRSETEGLRDHVVSETRRGIGLDGAPMPRLSPPYARKVGRTERTLYLSGQMLRAVKVRKNRALSYTMYIDGARNLKLAAIHNAQTPWWGPRPSWRRGRKDRLAQAGRRALDRVGSLRIVRTITLGLG